MARYFSVYKNIKISLAAAGELPDEYETENAPFVYDQGKTSMCCACANLIASFT